MEALKRIQKELKAPKGQYNNFGKYAYRSCEDILEAVKPLLGDAVLTLNDEIVEIGARIYVKATATLIEGGASIPVSAYAREPDSRKGMDESQITGSTSSYARKYALNGLFCIDDCKDADTQKPKDKPAPEPARKTRPEQEPPPHEDEYAPPLDEKQGQKQYANPWPDPMQNEGPDPSTEPVTHRDEIHNLLLEMNGMNKASASAQLKALTSFTTKEGKEVPGKTHVKFLTDKQVPFLLKRVRDLHDSWSAGN